MWTEWRRIVALVLVCLLPAFAIHAGPPTEAEIAARAHFELGRRHHELGEYDQAITEFKAAYLASAIPLFLFNIAQSYRRAGDTRQAIAFYKRFLELAPYAEERPEVERTLDQLQRSLPSDAPLQPPSVVLTPTVQPTPVPRSTRRRTGIIVGVTVGVAAIVGAAVALGVVFGRHQDLPASDLGTYPVFR
jgi:tetratricopeptide (TPR) repeat protein